MRSAMLTLIVLFCAQSAWGACWAPTKKKTVELHNRAVASLNKQDFDSALDLVTKAIAIEDCGLHRVVESEVLLRQGADEQALSKLEVLAGEHKKRVMVWVLMARAHFTLQDWPAALTASNQAIALEPTSALAMSGKVMVSLRTGDHDDLRRDIAKARETANNPTFSCFEVRFLVAEDKLDEAHEAMKTCLRSEDPSEIANADSALDGLGGGTKLSDRIHEAFDAENWEQCIVLSKKHLAKEPGDLADMSRIGSCAFNMNDYPLALQYLEQALKGDEWVNVDEVGLMRGVLTKRHEKDLKRGKHDVGALYVRVLIVSEQLDRADAELVRVRGLLSGDSSALAAVEIKLHMHQGRLDEAWKTAGDAAEQWSQASGVWDAIEQLAGKQPERLPEPWRSRFATSEPVQAAFAKLAREQKRFEECGDIVDAALSGQSADPAFWRSMGCSCAFDAGDPERYEALLQGVELTDEQTSYWFDLGVLWERSEQWDRALAAYQNVRGEHAGKATQNQWRLHVRKGDLDKVPLDEASGGEVNPVLQFNLAVGLHNAGKRAEAKALWTVACPRLDGDVGARCASYLQE